MRLRGYLLILYSLFFTFGLQAQNKSEYTTSRILILLDRSSSMIQPWSGGKTKSKAADELILKLMDSIYTINPDVEFSLRVFGHQFTVPENNCHDTKNEVPFEKDNRTRMAYRLADIQPLGVTAIAYSLQEAAEHDLLDPTHNAYSILLITDGGESCGGDICAVMRTLINNKIYFKPYIISLEDYAPLRAAYACMGEYLQVLKEGDMTPAVATIVEAFKPILKIKTVDFKDLQTIAANAPSVLKVNTPPPAPVEPVKAEPVSVSGITPAGIKAIAVSINLQAPHQVAIPAYEPLKTDEPAPVEEAKPVRPAPEKIAALTPVKPKKIETAVGAMRYVEPVTSPSYEPVVAAEPPERPAPEKVARASLSGLKLLPVEVAASKKPRLVTGPELPKLVIDTPATPKPIDKIAKIQPLKLRQFGIIWVVEEHTFPFKVVPPLPPLKVDIPKVKPGTKPVVTKEPEAPTGEYTIEREDAKETTVEVYFTNGHGKFYSTTPQVLLLNPVTGAFVKKFFRTVDANDNPDPQTGIPPGTYNLTFPESSGLTEKNVKVVEHQRNKIIVTVHPASLSFEYTGAKDRPMVEFSAEVIERNKPNGRVQIQKCTEKLEYEPGNYHVRINTFPVEVRNVDLEFNEKVLDILQPGFAKFTAASGMSTVTLYQRLGDKFLNWYTLNLSDPRSQHLQIQPGEYQAHYHKGPGGPGSSEKVVPFVIKATQQTEIQLN